MHLATVGAVFALCFFAYRAYKTLSVAKGDEKSPKSSKAGKTPPGPKRLSHLLPKHRGLTDGLSYSFPNRREPIADPEDPHMGSVQGMGRYLWTYLQIHCRLKEQHCGIY